jgi:predicted Zn-dependent peptidase
MERYTLDNGLRVTLVPYGSVPKVSAELVVRAGNAQEAAGETWLADLTAKYLKEGTASRTAEQVSKAVARMGGNLRVSAGENLTTLRSSALSEFAPALVRLLGEVVQQPRLPAAQLKRLRADLLRRLSVARSQPQQLAQERFRRLLYGEHPYGRVFPTPEMLTRYTVADVERFHRENFGAGRAHLFVVGQFDAWAVKAAAQEAFGGWTRGDAFRIEPPQPVKKRVLEVVNRKGAVQSVLMVGLPVVDPSHPDFLPLQVMNTLLGGSFTSRITSNIREQKGYTYSPRSQVDARYRDAYWVEIADVSTKVTGPALREILAEIERLRQEAPSEAELSGFRTYLAGLFVILASSRRGLLERLRFVDLHDLGDGWLASYVPRVQAVTPAQVQAMAQKYLDPAELTIVVVGDREKIAEQLAPFAPPGAGGR